MFINADAYWKLNQFIMLKLVQCLIKVVYIFDGGFLHVRWICTFPH